MHNFANEDPEEHFVSTVPFSLKFEKKNRYFSSKMWQERYEEVKPSVSLKIYKWRKGRYTNNLREMFYIR